MCAALLYLKFVSELGNFNKKPPYLLRFTSHSYHLKLAFKIFFSNLKKWASMCVAFLCVILF